MALRVKPNRFLVNAHGRPTAVVLSILDYRKLLRLLEDVSDAAALRRAVRTSRNPVPYEKFLAHLKRRHLI